MHTLSFTAFDTLCSIKITEDELAAVSLHQDPLAQAQSLCAHCEELFSAFIATSDICRLSAAAGNGQWVDIDVLTYRLLLSTLPYCQRYGQVFDISIGPAAQLWDFHTNSTHAASPDDALRAAAYVDYTAIELSRTQTGSHAARLLHSSMSLDLGGAAKGYIADVLAAQLMSLGIQNALINLGGNIYALGSHPTGRGWRIAIMDPRSSSHESLIEFESRNLSVVTSGSSKRSFMQGDKLMHHVLDPATGMPRTTDLLQASIISKNSHKADCLATTAFALGFSEAQKVIEDEGVGGVLLRNTGELWTSPWLNPSCKVL